MSKTYEELLQELTGPGGQYELEETTIRGVPTRTFKNIPPSMRQLFDVCRTRGDRSFLVYEDEDWSFADVMSSHDALGDVLVHRYGVQPGDRVAIAMRNYPEWIIAFAAITSVGAIAVSMNAWWKRDELAYGLEDSGASVLIGDRERIEIAAPSLAQPGLQGLAVRAEGPLPEGVERWEDVVTPGAPLPEVEIHPDDDATILYTSGTTGFPKGAVSSHRAVLSALACFGLRASVHTARYPKDSEGHPYPPCFILCVPLFHVTGCIAVTLTSFASGARIVMMHKWNPERALELVERERITNFVGVPTMSWDLLESPAFGKYDTSSLLSVGGGGAPAPPTLVERVDKSFGRARPGIGYGMTETNAYGPQNAGDDYIERPTSAGRAVPPMELRVTDEEGNPLPPGGVGEIWFRGPNLIRGYWNKPEATAETLKPGRWLATGDIGRLEDGWLYINSRARDMILRAAENIYPAEIEHRLDAHPSVAESAVVGVDHETLGQEVKAFVVLAPGFEIDLDELARFTGEGLAAIKVPAHWEIHPEPLPRNAAGKILKTVLTGEAQRTQIDE